jgi:hypothetical protein
LSKSELASSNRAEYSPVWAVIIGVVSSIPFSITITRPYAIFRELLYRFNSNSEFSKFITYMWFDPGVYGDILFLAMLGGIVHLIAYPILFWRKSRRQHLKYLLVVTLISVASVILAAVVLNAMSPLQSF